MTHDDIVYDRRVRLLNYAAEIGNVTEACRVFGVSRKTYYEWLKKAEQYGLSALLPKPRRRPHQPNQMSPEEVSVILAEAVARPTLGPRSLLRHLRARGLHRSASGVAKVLRRHHLGTARRQQHGDHRRRRRPSVDSPCQSHATPLSPLLLLRSSRAGALGRGPMFLRRWPPPTHAAGEAAPEDCRSGSVAASCGRSSQGRPLTPCRCDR